MGGIGLKCILLMGIYCILMIMLWIHMVISLTTQSKNTTYFVSRYFTLITSILYSIQPIFAISSSIMYYINPDPSVDSPIAWVVTALYIIPLFMMFALFILRLDITFRKSHFAHKREHIKIIWCIYVFVILLFIITTALFTIQLDIPAIILASISIVLFLSFITTLFVMFIKKLKQIALATDMANESKFVSNLAFKLTILFSFSILSSVIGMILASIVAVFFDNNPDIFYYLSDLVLSTDATFNSVLIYLSVFGPKLYYYICCCAEKCFKKCCWFDLTSIEMTKIELMTKDKTIPQQLKQHESNSP